jgi:predicted DNA-binding protein (MmcQ/YjbR family)
MTVQPKPSARAVKLGDVLAAAALRYPNVIEDHPWGHRAMKVGGKTFAWIVPEGATVSLTVKLPRTRYQALMLPNATPTGYGLGKSGWVTVTLTPPASALRTQCLEWLDESYRAVAPKTLVRALDAPPPSRRRASR